MRQYVFFNASCVQYQILLPITTFMKFRHWQAVLTIPVIGSQLPERNT